MKDPLGDKWMFESISSHGYFHLSTTRVMRLQREALEIFDRDLRRNLTGGVSITFYLHKYIVTEDRIYQEKLYFIFPFKNV